MNRTLLMDYLEKQTVGELIELLKNAYDVMTAQQCRDVFGYLEKEYLSKSLIEGKKLLKRIQFFKEESLRGAYYTPSEARSKNYTDVPEKTEQWFEDLATLLMESTQLSLQGDHHSAIKCFDSLFSCIQAMESNAEIVDAHEYGMWMLPIREKPYIMAYIKSAAALLTPERYTATVLPMIVRDSSAGFCNKVYEKVKRIASEGQFMVLKEVIEEQNIKCFWSL